MNQRQTYQFPTVQYVKRLRMSIDFRERPEAAAGPAPLPTGFYWIPWHPSLTDVHGRVKYLSFRKGLDAVLFPTFTRFDACLNLMRTIASHPTFVSRGTWLIGRWKGDNGEFPLTLACGDGSDEKKKDVWPITSRSDEVNFEFCATIQGLRSTPEVCAIQNVAVRPEFRGLGLGRALLMKALEGFRGVGANKATLEATAQNHPAIRLYESAGFRVYQTVYKEAYIKR